MAIVKDANHSPLKTSCEVCHKAIIADSSCAGVEMGNDSKIFYFCSQEHATQWSNEVETGTNES